MIAPTTRKFKLYHSRVFLCIFALTFVIVIPGNGQTKVEDIETNDPRILIQILSSWEGDADEIFWELLDKLKTKSHAENYLPGILSYHSVLFQRSKDILPFAGALDSLQSNLVSNLEIIPLENEIKFRISIGQLAVKFRNSFIAKEQIYRLQSLPLDVYQTGIYHLMKADLHGHLGELDEAVSEYFIAELIFIESDDDYLLYHTYNGLAIAFNSLGEFDSTLKFYKMALDVAERSGNPENKMKAYSNIGIAYVNLGEYELALKHYEKGFEFAKIQNMPLNQAQNLLNIGNLYKKKRDFSKALDYYNASIKLCKQHFIDYGLVLNYMNLSEIYQEQNAYEQSLGLLDSAFYYVEKMGFKKEKSFVLKSYATLFEKSGDYKNALAYFKSFSDLEKEVLNQESKSKIDEYLVRYELLENERKLMEAQLEAEFSDKIIKVLGISLCSFVLVFAVVTVYHYRNKKHVQIIQVKNRELDICRSSKISEVLQNSKELTNPNHELFKNIVRLLEQEEIYKDPNLSVKSLAERLNSNEKYISKAINEYWGSNFNQMINDYRVKACKNLMSKNPDHTINEIMYEVGFNSRTAYYNAFLKNTGVSPSKFKNQLGSRRSKITDV